MVGLTSCLLFVLILASDLPFAKEICKSCKVKYQSESSTDVKVQSKLFFFLFFVFF